ncbi:hypothetical protein FBZ94_11436 [Bradyrhizobium sacchari]|uniref:Uncharacterized protein n=1 Tax=Bradyrhizobium sacchari TaxID=1399419 RepID=A0A560HUD6_9BRAD|nr:hypothetical protein FBZ94_11436 [Bradyrhizobium sacchari]TWB67915.1 hypothetical protein FBZ95_11336 [Bradyrhizobium sacchari]
MLRRDRFNGATANKPSAPADGIKTARLPGDTDLSLSARRPSDVVPSVHKVN